MKPSKVYAFIFLFICAQCAFGASRSVSVTLEPDTTTPTNVQQVAWTPLDIVVTVPGVTITGAELVVRDDSGTVLITTNAVTVNASTATFQTVAGNWGTNFTANMNPGESMRFYSDVRVANYGNPLPPILFSVRYSSATGEETTVPVSSGTWATNGAAIDNPQKVDVIGGAYDGSTLTIDLTSAIDSVARAGVASNATNIAANTAGIATNGTNIAANASNLTAHADLALSAGAHGGEQDTLDDVAGRGDTTSTELTLNGGATIEDGITATATDKTWTIVSDNTSNRLEIKVGAVGLLAYGINASGLPGQFLVKVDDRFAVYSGSTEKSRMDVDGHIQGDGVLTMDGAGTNAFAGVVELPAGVQPGEAVNKSQLDASPGTNGIGAVLANNVDAGGLSPTNLPSATLSHQPSTYGQLTNHTDNTNNPHSTLGSYMYWMEMPIFSNTTLTADDWINYNNGYFVGIGTTNITITLPTTNALLAAGLAGAGKEAKFALAAGNGPLVIQDQGTQNFQETILERGKQITLRLAENGLWQVTQDSRTDVGASALRFYPVTEESTDFPGESPIYRAVVSSTEDPLWSTNLQTVATAVASTDTENPTTCTIHITDPGSIIGTLPETPVTLSYKTERTSGSTDTTFWVLIYKLDADTNLTLLATSSSEHQHTSSSPALSIVNAVIPSGTVLTGTDSLLFEFVATKDSGGASPTLTLSFEDDSGTAYNIGAPASSISHGVLAGRDDPEQHPASSVTQSNTGLGTTVQDALTTLAISYDTLGVQDPTNGLAYWIPVPVAGSGTVTEAYVKTHGMTCLVDIVRQNRTNAWYSYDVIANDVAGTATGVVVTSFSSTWVSNSYRLGMVPSGISVFATTNMMSTDFKVEVP